MNAVGSILAAATVDPSCRVVVVGGGWQLAAAWRPYAQRLSFASAARDQQLSLGLLLHLTKLVTSRRGGWGGPTPAAPRYVVLVGGDGSWARHTGGATEWFSDRWTADELAALTELARYGPAVGIHVCAVGRVPATQLYWLGTAEAHAVATTPEVRRAGQNIRPGEALVRVNEDWGLVELQSPPAGASRRDSRPALFTPAAALVALGTGPRAVGHLAVEAARWQYRFPGATSRSAILHYLRLASSAVPSEWAAAYVGLAPEVSA